MVMCLAEPKRDLLHIKNNVQWLEDLQNQPDLKEKDPRRGSWTYMPDFARGSGDPSNSQFAMLALYEAERVGVPVKERTWRLALDYWVRQQNNDGSWSYFPTRNARHRQHDLRGNRLGVHRLGPIERWRCGSYSAGT